MITQTGANNVRTPDGYVDSTGDGSVIFDGKIKAEPAGWLYGVDSEHDWEPAFPNSCWQVLQESADFCGL